MPSLLTAVVVAAGLAIAGTQAAPGPSTGRAQAPGLTGELLVATEDIRDPRFHHAVIYLLQHDASGAMGVVVNRPLADAPLAALLDKLGRDSDGVTGTIRIHYGGPVEAGAGFVLHTSEWTSPRSHVVRDGVAVTTDPAILDAIARGSGPRRALFASGYAGWGPGQLEAEIERGAWITVAADEALIFASDAAGTWERAMSRQKLLL
jgi:putative transcriptional regulator